jgi:hypothetical protein
MNIHKVPAIPMRNLSTCGFKIAAQNNAGVVIIPIIPIKILSSLAIGEYFIVSP